MYDDDWWNVFWNEYVTDPEHLVNEAFESLDKVYSTYRRVTGESFILGPKL